MSDNLKFQALKLRRPNATSITSASKLSEKNYFYIKLLNGKIERLGETKRNTTKD